MTSIGLSHATTPVGDAATVTFFAALFQHAPSDLFFLVWTLPDKTSRWYRCAEWESAAADVRELVDEHDVYVGVGLSDRDRGPHHRVEAHEVVGIVGVAVDLDEGKSYSAGEHEARALLASALPEHQPSLVVSSGHGVQPWWIFAETWIFSDDHERDAAMHFVAEFQAYLRSHSDGRTIDATHDLARVWRVPFLSSPERHSP